MSQSKPEFSIKKDVPWLGPLLANLLYFGGFAVVMAGDMFPKDPYMDAPTYALLVTFPVYLILYGILAYKFTKRILLPQVLYFLFLAAFGVFYMADNWITEGLGSICMIALVSTGVCTGISLLTKVVVRNEPPVPAPFPVQGDTAPAPLPVQDAQEAYPKFLYWCISDEHWPNIARARMDVPYRVLFDALNEEEQAKAKHLVLHRLAESDSIFYVHLAAYCKDTAAIPLIEKKLKGYKLLKSSYDVSVCKDALRSLKTKR